MNEWTTALFWFLYWNAWNHWALDDDSGYKYSKFYRLELWCTAVSSFSFQKRIEASFLIPILLSWYIVNIWNKQSAFEEPACALYSAVLEVIKLCTDGRHCAVLSYWWLNRFSLLLHWGNNWFSFLAVHLYLRLWPIQSCRYSPLSGSWFLDIPIPLFFVWLLYTHPFLSFTIYFLLALGSLRTNSESKQPQLNTREEYAGFLNWSAFSLYREPSSGQLFNFFYGILEKKSITFLRRRRLMYEERK